MKSTSPLRIGSRKSALAMTQTQQVINCMDLVDEYQIIPIISSGDKIPGLLRDYGGKSLFTKELDLALLNGEIDLAVHSMKDVETPLHKGLEIAAVPIREDPRDVLIYHKDLDLENFPPGTKIGTSSLRRAFQLRHYMKMVEIVPCRGNIQTRLQKFANKEMSAIVLAMAGLKRMGLYDNGFIKDIPAKTLILDPLQYVPAAGQGALVVVKRVGNERFDHKLSKINHHPSRLCIDIERKIVEGLNVTCHDPIGVYAKIEDDIVYVNVMLFTEDNLPLKMAMKAPINEAHVNLLSFIDLIKSRLVLKRDG